MDNGFPKGFRIRWIFGSFCDICAFLRLLFPVAVDPGANGRTVCVFARTQTSLVCAFIIAEMDPQTMLTIRVFRVEFQSKFYGGHGYPFTPFSFEKILAEERAAEEQL